MLNFDGDVDANADVECEQIAYRYKINSYLLLVLLLFVG